MSPPPVMVADIGNSALKLALATTNSAGQIELGHRLHWLHDQLSTPELESWAPSGKAQWWIASVHRGKATSLKEWISKSRSGQSIRELTHLDIPLLKKVDAPEKVGIDRLLTAVAANRRRAKDSPAITITAGTAVTVNAIDETGAFLGGAILPGWPLLAKSLHQYTDALPLVSDGARRQQALKISAIGKNTTAAIASGIFLGLQGAVLKLIEQFEKELGGAAELYFAGGDAAELHRALGRGMLTPDLVLEGAAILALPQAHSP